MLGTLEAVGAGGPIDLGGPRQRAVLARLLVARGEVVPVDRLIEDVWDGSPPSRAVGALHAYVSNLRRALEPDRPPRAPSTVIVSRPPGYALTLAEHDVDAWEFESLVRSRRPENGTTPASALHLWQGPAYAEFADRLWTAPEVARLDEVHTAAREQFAAAALESGDLVTAVIEAQSLTRDQPLREEGWKILATALHRSGRTADALAALRTARTRFVDDLGLDPGPTLDRLEHQILTGASTVQDTGDSDPEFLGRESEMDVLRSAAQPDSTQIVTVVGDAGSGKSSLMQQLARELAESNWTVAVGRCPEVDGAPPAWAWVEILRSLRRHTDPGPLSRPLSPLSESPCPTNYT